MSPQPHRLVTGPELGLERTHPHRVGFDYADTSVFPERGVGSVPYEVAQKCETSDAYREHPAPTPAEGCPRPVGLARTQRTRTHSSTKPRWDAAVANSTPLRVRPDPRPRMQRPPQEGDSSAVVAPRNAGDVPAEGVQPGGTPCSTTGYDVSEPALPLPDVPLIVEGLLMEAENLADYGAPTESVEAILDHVAALREGRV